MSRFLSKDNFEYVFNFAKQYLEDAKELKIDDPAEFQKIVATEMRKIGVGSDKGMSLEVLNKKAIVAVRDVVMSNQQNIRQEPEENTEDAFFKKLKELEFQRSVTIASVPLPPVQAAEEPPNTPAPVQLPPSTIIVNNTTAGMVTAENRISICLNSWARLWQYQTDRSSFIPDFSLQPDIDNNSLILKRIVIPNVATLTDWIPYFLLHIESAGKQVQEIIVYPSGHNPALTWIYLEPGSANVIKPLSTPWVLTVKDAYGAPLNLGHDGWMVRQIIHPQRGTTVLDMYHSVSKSVMRDFSVGDNVSVHNTQTNNTIHTRVIQTTSTTIEVSEKIPDANQQLFVLNQNRQISCIIEAKK